MSRTIKCLMALAGALLLHGAHADEYDEEYKRVGSAKTITAYGSDLFGDKVNIYNGGLEFVQQDVSLPGNNSLSVSVGRRRTTGDSISVKLSNPQGQTGVFGDWQLEIPHLHGTFSFGVYNKGWSPPDRSSQRCTQFGIPVDGSDLGGNNWASATGFWHGSFLYLPGRGDQEMVRRSSVNSASPGDNPGNYPIVTHDGYQVSCGINLVNGVGEGFIVTDPAGTRYRFDRIMAWYAPPYSFTPGAQAIAGRSSPLAPPGGGSSAAVVVAEYWIVPSIITDRFGNAVTYNWDAVDAKKLNSIVASDGRHLDFTYSDGPNISQVTDGNRIWKYGYTNGYLTTVTQPDNSAWKFDLTSVIAAPQYYSGSASCEMAGSLISPIQTATMTHPSGAVGTFKLAGTFHGRAYVWKQCLSKGGSPTDTYAFNPRVFATMALTSKSLSGPGLPATSWTYGYPTAVGSWSTCTSNCGGTKVVTVTDSEGKVVKHTFGTVWMANDGQLQKVEEGDASGTLRTTSYTYAAASDGGGQPFPNLVGSSDAEGDHFSVEQLTPQRSKITTQQAATFSWYANSFDSFARPVNVTKSSNLGYSKQESISYKDFTDGLWVIGLPQSVSVIEPSTTTQIFWNSYDTLGRLTTDYKFGFWQHIRTYNTDGTLATVTDGAQASHIIGLSNWKRGIPQTISYPTGHTKTAVVNDYGRITSLKDESDHTTGYGYDALGRLKTITYPTGDPVTYNATNVTFAPITGSAPYGLATGTWKQTLTTGNLLEENYFDALWRPVISHRKDTGTGKERFVVKSYDVDGHTLFESYPLDTLSS
ncbi:MAG TPA: RHS repeat domain-containing protein, partial [Ideonella sp.]|uniref:RHS repeat protein n=1 Tax=Ideonella sp. TaxID=1929293 RepID=UPI002BEB3A76